MAANDNAMLNGITPVVAQRKQAENDNFMHKTLSLVLSSLTNLVDNVKEMDSSIKSLEENDGSKKDSGTIKETAKSKDDVSKNPAGNAPFVIKNSIHEESAELRSTISKSLKLPNVSRDSKQETKTREMIVSKMSTIEKRIISDSASKKSSKALAPQKQQQLEIRGLDKVGQLISSVKSIPAAITKPISATAAGIKASVSSIMSLPAKISGSVLKASNTLAQGLMHPIESLKGLFGKLGSGILGAFKKIPLFGKKDKDNAEIKAAGVLVLASNVKNSASYIKEYERLVKVVNSTKKLSMKQLEDTQDKISTLTDNMSSMLEEKAPLLKPMQRNAAMLADTFTMMQIVPQKMLATATMSKLLTKGSMASIVKPIEMIGDEKDGLFAAFNKIDNKKLAEARVKSESFAVVAMSLSTVAMSCMKAGIAALIASKLVGSIVSFVYRSNEIIEAFNSSTDETIKSTKSIESLRDAFYAIMPTELAATAAGVLAAPAAIGAFFISMFMKSVSGIGKNMPDSKQMKTLSSRMSALTELAPMFIKLAAMEAIIAAASVLAIPAMVGVGFTALLMKTLSGLSGLIATTGEKVKQAYPAMVDLLIFSSMAVILETSVIISGVLAIPAMVGAALTGLFAMAISATLTGVIAAGGNAGKASAAMVLLVPIAAALIAVETLLLAAGLVARLANGSIKFISATIGKIKKNVIDRLDAAFIRSVSISIIGATLLTVLATIMTFGFAMLTVAAVLAIPALVGLAAFGLVALAFAGLGLIWKPVMKGAAAAILVSIAMVAAGFAIGIATKKLAESSDFIIANWKPIAIGLGAFMAIGGALALLSKMTSIQSILATILLCGAVVAAAYAVKIGAKALVEGTAVISDKATALRVLAGVAAFGAIAFGLAMLSKMVSVGGLLKTVALCAIVVIASLALTVAIVALVTAGKIILSDLPAVAAGLLGFIGIIALFTLVGFAATFALPAIAATMAAAIIIMVASLALTAAIAVLANVLSAEMIAAATERLKQLAGFLLSFIPLGGASLLVMVPAALMVAAGALLLVGSLAMLGAVTTFSKMPLTEKTISNVAQMKVFLSAVSGLTIPAGKAVIAAGALAKVGTKMKKAASGLSKSIKSFAKMEKSNITKAAVACVALKDIFTSLKDAAKASKGVDKNIEKISAASGGLGKVSSLIKTFDTIKVDDSQAKNAANVQQVVLAIDDVFTSIKKSKSLNKLKVDENMPAYTRSLADTLSAFNSISTDGLTSKAIELNSFAAQVSSMDTKGFKSSMSGFMKVLDNAGSKTKSIDKLTKSIRGLNSELKSLNSNSNALKAMSSFDVSSGRSRASRSDIQDAKAVPVASASSSFSRNDIDTLKSILEEIKSFERAYADNNKAGPNFFKR